LGAIALVGISYAFGKSKLEKYRDFFDKMSYKINKIKNGKISGGKLKFLLDILLQNNTAHEIDFSTFGIAKLKNVVVTDKNGKILGVVNKEIDRFTISENGSFLLENIAFEIILNEQYFLNLTSHLKTKVNVYYYVCLMHRKKKLYLH